MSVRKMLAEGVDTFVEIGPGSTLRGFVRKIDKSAMLLNVEDSSSLKSAVEYLNR
jgi:[acyl-carrier-protein] S-malonyltransferase